MNVNTKIFTWVCVAFLWTFAAFSEGAHAAKKPGDAASVSKKSEAGGEKETVDVYKRALEEMTPLTIGWTSDARDSAMEMDDGIVDPLDLAARAVRRTALPYREEILNAWRKLPPDKENPAQVEVDRFEKKLIQRIADFVVEWRKHSGPGSGQEEKEPSSGAPSKE